MTEEVPEEVISSPQLLDLKCPYCLDVFGVDSGVALCVTSCGDIAHLVCAKCIALLPRGPGGSTDVRCGVCQKPAGKIRALELLDNSPAGRDAHEQAVKRARTTQPTSIALDLLDQLYTYVLREARTLIATWSANKIADRLTIVVPPAHLASTAPLRNRACSDLCLWLQEQMLDYEFAPPTSYTVGRGATLQRCFVAVAVGKRFASLKRRCWSTLQSLDQCGAQLYPSIYYWSKGYGMRDLLNKFATKPFAHFATGFFLQQTICIARDAHACGLLSSYDDSSSVDGPLMRFVIDQVHLSIPPVHFQTRGWLWIERDLPTTIRQALAKLREHDEVVDKKWSDAENNPRSLTLCLDLVDKLEQNDAYKEFVGDIRTAAKYYGFMKYKWK
jgi:hypothetical protein